MRVENGKIVLADRVCFMGCNGSGLKHKFTPCPHHHQAVNRFPGRKCPVCGATRKFDHQYQKAPIATTCEECKGTGRVPENAGDSLPHIIWSNLRFVVYRSNRQQTYNENLLAVGCVYSVTDYGNHARMTDEALLAKVRDDQQGHQACSVTRSWEDLTLCHHVGIFCNNQGYSVRKVFMDAIPAIHRENTYEEGMRIGMRVARAGGNGTMAGIYKP